MYNFLSLKTKIKNFLWKYKIDISIFIFAPYGTVIIPVKYFIKILNKFRKNEQQIKKPGD